MSFGKSVRIYGAVLACGLLSQFPAAADTFISNSGNFAGGGVNNTQANGNGGLLPPRGGHYNLEAFASDSLTPPPLDRKKGPVAYGNPGLPTPGNPVPTLTDFQVADETGLAFDANAFAKITYPAAGAWSSAGSYASVCGPLNAQSPQGTMNPCGKNPNGETAKALSKVTDPWSFDVQSTDLAFINTVTFDAGLSLQALATGLDTGGASMFADDSTDLNGLGELWMLSWSVDSAHPGLGNVAFWSNPALGLNDALIASSFAMLLNDNLSTGTSTLTQSFSFNYQLTIPANTTATFTGDVMYEADGATGAPEPSSMILMFAGTSLLVLGKLRRKRMIL